MKKFIPIMSITLVTLALLTSCDSPRSQRAATPTTYNGLNGSGNVSAVNLDNGNSSTIAPTTAAAPGTAPVVPPDASHCKFSGDGLTGLESSSSHLGEHTICQSSTDKNIIYFQLKTPPTNASGDVNICFIPTTSNGSNSIYVGNPMCGTFKDPKVIRKINFVKYTQYANATINGVIFFKDLSWYYPVYNSYMMTLDAYKTCMNMLSYGNTAYCQSFKSVGQYIYRQF
jgi:hypothetical protein